ncbi:hypothetical protein Droror1_Dr00008169, partial [Drosera rotundifolia]
MNPQSSSSKHRAINPNLPDSTALSSLPQSSTFNSTPNQDQTAAFFPAAFAGRPVNPRHSVNG